MVGKINLLFKMFSMRNQAIYTGLTVVNFSCPHSSDVPVHVPIYPLDLIPPHPPSPLNWLLF